MDRGLNGGCENVGMADVLTDIADRTGRRITNASVYGRIWTTQTDFHRDLLVLAAEQFPDGEEAAMRAEADAVLSDADLSSLVGRVAALAEICRRAGKAHLESLAASRSWQTWLAIWAITVSTPTLDDDVERGPAIAHRHALAVEAMEVTLENVLRRLGGTIRPGITTYQLSMAIYALSEGLVLHDRFAPDDHAVVSHSFAADSSSSDLDWSLFSAALLGILERFVELN
jgi:hypothetical protein